MKFLQNLSFRTPLALYLARTRLEKHAESPGFGLLPKLAFFSIVLTVSASIVTLALANGLHYSFLERLADSEAPLTIVSVGRGIPAYQELISKIKKTPGITDAFPFAQNEAILKFYDETTGLIIKSYPYHFNTDSSFNKLFKLESGSWPFTHSKNIAIDRTVSRSLAIFVGDFVNVLVYDDTIGAVTYRFHVSGIFSSEASSISYNLAFINFDDAAEIFDFQNYAPMIGIRVKDKMYPDKYLTQIEKLSPFLCKTWKSANLSLLLALENEKKIVQTILTIFFTVVFLGILSIMTALVLEKRDEIALLKSLGMNNSQNFLSFLITGIYLGISASLFGIICGIGISLLFNEIIFLLEITINTLLQIISFVLHLDLEPFQFLNQNVYYLRTFPIKIAIIDIVFSATMAIMCCTLAAMYPAILSKKFKPAEILRKKAF